MNLRELQKQADFIGKNGIVFNCDCMEIMNRFTLEDKVGGGGRE